jgi:hypothetical protein
VPKEVNFSLKCDISSLDSMLATMNYLLRYKKLPFLEKKKYALEPKLQQI